MSEEAHTITRAQHDHDGDFRTPFAILKGYAAGILSEDELVESLSSWPFDPPVYDELRSADGNEEGLDESRFSAPGTWAQLRHALRRELITLELYRKIVAGTVGHYVQTTGQDALAALTGHEGGVWRVTTIGSTHVLDLNAGTVTRIPGSDSRPSSSDGTFRIRTLDNVRVQEAGLWTMFPYDWLIEYNWHRTSLVQTIIRDSDKSRASSPSQTGDTE